LMAKFEIWTIGNNLLSEFSNRDSLREPQIDWV
jgi:hypothetical protein